MVCLEAALKYADMGLSVIPIQPHSKKPLGAWEQYQGRIADSEEIKKWFAENPDANIAIVTGAVSNVVVIDLDSFEAKEALKKELSVFDIQFVPRSRTANGFHLFFKHPGGIVRNRTGILRKIDVRADGGYVVAPPSKHPSGRTYTWEVPLTPGAPELPPELYDLIVRNGMRQNGNGNKESGRITSGGRNARLTSFAGSMRRRGMTKEAILAALLVENESRCDPPLEEQEVEKIAKSISGYDLGVAKEIEHSTDLGNAQRLVRLHGEDLRYCYQLGWLVWDGRRWKRSEEGEIEQRAKDTVRSIYTEAASCPDEATRKALATHAKKSESEARIKAMISLAQSEPGIPIRIDELDHNPWLLNVKNGTLDLKGGDLRDHRREDLITKVVTVAYDPKAVCPTWDEFQKRITGGDTELIKFKQKRLGYCLTGDISEQCMFIDHVPGSNGKTTEQRTVQRLLGEYARQCPIETFLASKGDKIPNDIARLKGARLVIAAETEVGRRLAESLVKQVTGGDTIAARFLHKEFFEFTPEFKLWLAVNHKPNIRGTDHAIWRRIRLVPFTVTIPVEEQDPGLADRLADEFPGILRWAVDGLALWHAERLGKPEAVREATEAYRTEMDILGSFLADCCEINPDGEVASKELYQAYGEWCEENGERPVSQKDFGMRLTERGFHGGRQGKERTRTWEGLALLGGQKG